MPSFILNTCGTSVLTHQCSNEERSLLNKYTNAANWDAIPESDRTQIQSHLQQRQTQLLALSKQDAKKMSAELNGLLTWMAKSASHPQDEYWILATDTALGQAAAQMVQAWLESQKLRARGCTNFCVNGQLAGNCCTSKELLKNDRYERTNRQPAG